MNAPDHKAVSEVCRDLRDIGREDGWICASVGADIIEQQAAEISELRLFEALVIGEGQWDRFASLRAELEKLRQRCEAMEADARQMAKWIGRVAADNPTFYRDHACAQCVPYSDIIKPGFVCAIHTAAAIDGAGGGESK
jgi:hypothetical protein